MEKIFRALTIALVLGTMSAASAAPSCGFVFRDLPRGQSAEAIGDRVQHLRPSGQTSVLRQSRIQNQCQTSECYLFAFVGMVETSNLNLRPGLNSPEISAPYLFARKMIQWAQEKAWYRDESRLTHFFKGGYYSKALQLSRDHGLTPIESWKPKTDFESWDFAQLYNDVKAVATQSEKQIYGTFFNRWFKDRGQAAREQRYRDALPLIDEAVQKWTGPLPDQVSFRGQTLTTKEVEALYGVGHQEHLTVLYPENSWNYNQRHFEQGLNDAVTAFGGTWSYAPASAATITARLRKWVDAGAPVMVEMTWKNSGHAMFVTGYEKDARGDVRLWKLQNSWGGEWSDKGSGWYEPHDLYRNLWGAYFRSDSPTN